MATHFFIQVSRPLFAHGGSLQAPLCPPPRPVQRKSRCAPRKKDKKQNKEKKKENATRKREQKEIQHRLPAPPISN